MEPVVGLILACVFIWITAAYLWSFIRPLVWILKPVFGSVSRRLQTLGSDTTPSPRPQRLPSEPAQPRGERDSIPPELQALELQRQKLALRRELLRLETEIAQLERLRETDQPPHQPPPPVGSAIFEEGNS